ncbi:MAG TPA: GNAT family N-acetyltransferase [Mycobacteriales bacterium]|nr:GNAT family N-acetyltransferase [Mycobacteriales bacterium]
MGRVRRRPFAGAPLRRGRQRRQGARVGYPGGRIHPLRLRRRRRAVRLHRAWRTGRGLGGVLIRTAIESAEAAGIWTLEAGIFPENVASLAVHRAAGFRVVGRRERIGCHRGRWRDTLLLERRFRVVGPG